MTIEEVELPEATRRNEVFNKLVEIDKSLSNLSVFPSLLWLWVFDIIKDIFDNNQYKDLAVNDYIDEAVPEGITLQNIFDQLWDDVEGLGLTMDSGGQIIEEVIRDWMRENDFLVALDDDSWLNGPESD